MSDPCEEEKRKRREYRQLYEKSKKKIPKKQRLNDCLENCRKRYSRKKKRSIAHKTMPVLSSKIVEEVTSKKGVPVVTQKQSQYPPKIYPMVKVQGKKLVPLVDVTTQSKEIKTIIEQRSKKIYELQPYISHLSSGGNKPIPPGLLIRPAPSTTTVKSPSDLRNDYQKMIGACKNGDIKSFNKHFNADGCIEGLQIIAEAPKYHPNHEQMFIKLIDLFITSYKRMYIAPVCFIVLLKLTYSNKALLLGSLVEAMKAKEPSSRKTFVKIIKDINSKEYRQKIKDKFPSGFLSLFTKNKYIQLESFAVGLKVNKECMGLFVQLYDGKKEDVCFAAKDSNNTVVFDYCKIKKESLNKVEKELKELSHLPEIIKISPQNYLNEALEYGNSGMVDKVFDSMKKNNLQIDTNYHNVVERIASIRKSGILSTYIRHLFQKGIPFSDKDKIMVTIAYNLFVSWYPTFFNLSDFKLISLSYYVDSLPKGVSEKLYTSSIQMIPRHMLMELVITK